MMDSSFKMRKRVIRWVRKWRNNVSTMTYKSKHRKSQKKKMNKKKIESL